MAINAADPHILCDFERRFFPIYLFSALESLCLGGVCGNGHTTYTPTQSSLSRLRRTPTRAIGKTEPRRCSREPRAAQIRLLTMRRQQVRLLGSTAQDLRAQGFMYGARCGDVFFIWTIQSVEDTIQI